MSELIEIVFEDVQVSRISKLLMRILDNSESIAHVQCNNRVPKQNDRKSIEDQIHLFESLNEGAVLMTNIERIYLGDIVISNALIRIIKYDNKFDLDINFETNDVSPICNSELISTLHKHTSICGKRYGAKQWFAGMEPASDEETRYFTNNQLGPLG